MDSRKFRAPLKSGYTYHIFNQGNNKEDIFKEEKNYAYFLRKYKEFISPIADTYAYCLLPNHFHIALRIKSFEDLHNSLPNYFPKPDLSNFERESFNESDKIYDKKVSRLISRKFASWFGAYSMAVNKGYDRSGKLFDLPFKRIEVMDEEYFTFLICYIHRNPIHHKFHGSFETWRHSSYFQILDYLKLHESNSKQTGVFIDEHKILDFNFLLEWFKTSKRYKERHKDSLEGLDNNLWLE